MRISPENSSMSQESMILLRCCASPSTPSGCVHADADLLELLLNVGLGHSLGATTLLPEEAVIQTIGRRN